MTKKLQIYKCEICGNIVEVLHTGKGELVCCGQLMDLLPEKTEEQGNEKHVPVIERTEEGIKVKIGAVAHPMEDAHYIEWIEIISDGRVYRKFLSPGDTPEADFAIVYAGIGEKIEARDYCNIHGLWKRS